ncbi:MAG: prepilin-type N-terminal cleavage/methylation domain-containing protein [Gemmatimonadaceae bacterium]|nr:prepilin-type N-terminal cleavage/methylation domain-containing protein [Gemmatimonadaceae bacterium]
MTITHTRRRSRRWPRRSRNLRQGFTLIETVLAMTILSAIVLMIGLGTSQLQRAVGDAGIRSRAHARADMQIGLARTWPTWSTLERLSASSYNGLEDGLRTTTVVTADTTGRRRIKRVRVTVEAVPASLMPSPVTRNISIAIP